MKYKGKKMKPHRINQLKKAKLNRSWELLKMRGLYLTPEQIKRYERFMKC
jgi:hypothetical protein